MKINQEKIKNDVFSVIFTILSITSIVFIAPHFTEHYRQKSIYTQQFVSGTVLEISENNIQEDPFVDGRFTGNQKFTVRINEGEYKGQVFSSVNTLGSLRSAIAYEGLTAVFTIRLDKNGQPVVWLYNYNRQPYIYLLAIFLAVIVILVGRIKGLRSLLALAFSGTVILYIVVPGMWTEHPMAVAVLSSTVICAVSFIQIADFSKKALVAAGGTFTGIIFAGFLAFIFGRIMNLSGVDMEKGESLLYLAQNRNFKISSILFVSILISCLGATMDIAISVASSAEQLFLANSKMPLKQYFSSVLAVGHDIIGTMTNTLILAFCGASLPLAMMIWGYHMNYIQFINIPLIVIKILQALCGSIGMVTSVWFTAIYSVFAFKQKAAKKQPATGDIHTRQ